MITKTARAALLLALVGGPVACNEFGSEPSTPVPTTVTVESPVDSLAITATAQLTTTVLDQDGEPLPNAEVTFTSSSMSVASVSSTGVVTGQGEGTATITAQAGEATDQVVVEVYDPPCSVADIAVGATVNGQLQQGDCFLQEQDGISYLDVWLFTLADSSEVTISMTSTQLDAYLFLTDNDLNDLAQDDDSGGGTNAMITDTLPAGDYAILAGTWPETGGGSQTGSYSVTLNATAAGAVVAGEAARPGALSIPAQRVPSRVLRRR